MKLQKIFLYTLLGFIAFLSLVFFNFRKAQDALQQKGQSPLGVQITTYPKTVRPDETANIVWDVDAAPDLSTSYTTIYWGYESTPSSLTKSDSPQAVGYPYFATDYTTGFFGLPSTFDQNIRFDNLGKVYFRAYARVGTNHLWSVEESVTVEK